MAIGISYVYKNPNVAGESCPASDEKAGIYLDVTNVAAYFVSIAVLVV